jgi:hypothetical protein
MRISDRFGGSAPRLALIVAGLLVIACVGPAGTPVPDESGDPPNNATRPPDRPLIETFLAWIIGLGPGSPKGPPEIDVYLDITKGTEESCRAAFNAPMDPPETETLYHGAAAACLAALHGKEDRWTDAESAFAELSQPDGCLDQATFKLLKSTLDAHHADPNARFTLQGRPKPGDPESVPLPCPRIQDVKVTRSGGTLEIKAGGTQLDKVVQLSYAPVESCPMPKDMTSQTSVEAIRDGDLVRGTITSDQEALVALWLWVGAVVTQGDWVADSDCVSVDDVPAADTPVPSL